MKPRARARVYLISIANNDPRTRSGRVWSSDRRAKVTKRREQTGEHTCEGAKCAVETKAFHCQQCPKPFDRYASHARVYGKTTLSGFVPAMGGA